jgi:hypothetical protein
VLAGFDGVPAEMMIGEQPIHLGGRPVQLPDGHREEAGRICSCIPRFDGLPYVLDSSEQNANYLLLNIDAANPCRRDNLFGERRPRLHGRPDFLLPT